MAKNLVIVESPTKAKTISKFLGPSYKVMATVGHLRDLPKSKLGIDIEDNFEPQYINVRGRAPTINELKKESKKSDKIYLATDPDREGEAIAWHMAFLLDLDLDEKNRVEFNEITKENVKKAIDNPRKIDLALVDAQQARRVLDRLVGYKLSPQLWKRIKNGLSAGRVQSVALRLICEREEEINAFVPEEYWSITAQHKESNIEFESSYYGDLINGKEAKRDRISNEKEASEILNSMGKKSFNVFDVKKSKRRRNPYPPFTTSTLQQESSRRLGFSASKTMNLAQKLFEGISIGNEGTVGLISYTRTDSTRLSSTIVAEAKDYVVRSFGDGYSKPANYEKKKSGSQDAHEAIRPTSIKRTPAQIQDYIKGDMFKLYDLIWKRTVASQMKAAVYDVSTVKLEDNNRLFRATGNVMSFDGFMRLWPAQEKQNQIPELKRADQVKVRTIDKNQHFTKPPARYTEASLVKTLEEEGIGRPSTYASIINNIKSRNYVDMENRSFFPTDIGKTVNDYLVKHYENIINVEFTSELEDRLDNIAEEGNDWRDLISTFYGQFESLLEKAEKDGSDYKIKDKVLSKKCPDCGKNLVEKHGRNGKFVGCSGFPDCTYTESIVITTGVECPKCGNDIVEKVTKKGKKFFGCSNYPSCDYASWNRPTGEKCPECGDLLTRKKNRHGDFIVCNNDNCNFEKENK